MKIRSGATWVNPSGNTQEFNIELDENDGVLAVGAEAWKALGLRDRYKVLQKEADRLVVGYMYQNHAISEEFARQRLAEIG